MIPRLCNLPKSCSFFLLGPRQTGKTTIIQQLLINEKVFSINLLDRSVFLRYLTNPNQFYLEAVEKIKTEQINVVFIDEIQKIPELLDEVQRLIQEFDLVCILTGSSARKLKRSGANLLGGRALEKKLFPFTYLELKKDFNLDRVLKYGSLPNIILNPDSTIRVELLNSYVSTYLAEEIQQESLVRNLPGFVNFLEVVAQRSGELLNFSKIGREASLYPRTVQSYYEILTDTLIGLMLPAYFKSASKRLRSTPKFYLFDIGIINTLEKQLRSDPDVNRYGRLFEHFIILETYRIVKYLSIDARIFFWRTKDGQEVDLLIENKGQLIAAIEIKSSSRITAEYLSGIRSFKADYPDVATFVVAKVSESFELEDTKILPWEKFLADLPKYLN